MEPRRTNDSASLSAKTVRAPMRMTGPVRVVCLLAISAAVWLPGLGTWERLSYHEAFVAQGAREMLDSGEWSYPTIGGRPWLEKPPLPWWLVVAIGRAVGGVDETVARLPSAIAATLMVLGVSTFATRYYGPGLGLIAGAVQATTAWSALRGRLAEADILLAALVTWTVVAFDRMLVEGSEEGPVRRRWRWAFFVLLGTMSMVKGIGFGPVLTVGAIASAIVWRRDGRALRSLMFPAGWIVSAAIALAWPIAMIARHGTSALSLWILHVADRLAERPSAFIGEPWWEYVPGVFAQAMPWAPIAVVGAWHSLRRGVLGRLAGGTVPASVVAGDRLLWAWSAAPLVLLSMATIKNAHYAIAAQVPWSIWAALGLARISRKLVHRGRSPERLKRVAAVGFATLAILYGMGFSLLAPGLDWRGREGAFYETAGRRLPPGTPVALLYDDFDRNPYESPFGAVPHDLGVRLFYLRRPARVIRGRRPGDETPAEGRSCPPALRVLRPTSEAPVYLIARERDRPDLDRLGRLELLERGPSTRFDREYHLFRLDARPMAVADLDESDPTR